MPRPVAAGAGARTGAARPPSSPAPPGPPPKLYWRGPPARRGRQSSTVRPVTIAMAAIPAVVAAMIAVPLATQTEVPVTASGPYDRISVEYAKHELARISHGGGLVGRTAAERTEILSVSDDGALRYVLVEAGEPRPEVTGMLDEAGHRRLAAMIKETGFAAIGSSFEAAPDAARYEQYSVKVTLNGATSRVSWPEPGAAASFVPPIVTAVGHELDMIMGNLSAGIRYK